jgi:hypothetical protein
MEGHAHRTEGTKGNMFISSLIKKKERKKERCSEYKNCEIQWGKKMQDDCLKKIGFH